MQVKLKEIANIQFGYYGQPSKDGTIPYLQAKHFNEFGQFIGDNDAFLKEDSKAIGSLLQDGDVLFVAKGFRFFATLYKEEFGKAIASSIFFILRPNKTRVIPAYLVSVLNLPKNLLHFQQSGAGSSIPSIRKNELATVRAGSRDHPLFSRKDQTFPAPGAVLFYCDVFLLVDL